MDENWWRKISEGLKLDGRKISEGRKILRLKETLKNYKQQKVI